MMKSRHTAAKLSAISVTETYRHWRLFIPLLVLAAMTLFLLAGCDADKPDPEEQPAAETSPVAGAPDSDSEEPSPGWIGQVAPEADAAEGDQIDADKANPGTQMAVARGVIVDMQPTEGNEAAGTVIITQQPGGGLHMALTLSGLGPGKHGFHVHETGDCSAPDAASAGEHFNPGDLPHGAPSDEKQHAGDLGNISADDDGNVKTSVSSKQLNLEGEQGISGRALIVHRDPDDLKSQPSGAAGARVACGVIGKQAEG